MNAVVFVTLDLFIAFVFVYIAARMANKRGRSARGWMWAAVISGPLAISVLAMLSKKSD
ncbi:MAG TPA: hypothetical protein VGM72_13015 [Micropepsaceae bacterium]|jgi:hypothetical protein